MLSESFRWKSKNRNGVLSVAFLQKEEKVQKEGEEKARQSGEKHVVTYIFVLGASAFKPLSIKFSKVVPQCNS